MAETVVGEVILKNVRLSFADLFKPGKPMKDDDGNEQPGKYRCNLLLEGKNSAETKANMAKLRAASEQVKEKTWGPKNQQPKLKANQVCVRDGDEENWDGYEDTYYVSCNNQNQPVLVDRVKDANGKWMPLTLENGGPKKLYSGANVNAVVRIWGQKSRKLDNGKTIPNRLNASIESVQFYKHGEPFAGGKPVDPNEKFDDVEEADDGTVGEDEDNLI